MFLFSGTTVRADSVTTTVTAVGKKETPPEIKKDDVKLYSGKEQMQVANWRRGDSLFLAVLIDDSLDPRLAQNFNDLKAFFMAQPQSTYIAVAYSRMAPPLSRKTSHRIMHSRRKPCVCLSEPAAPSPARIFRCRIG